MLVAAPLLRIRSSIAIRPAMRDVNCVVTAYLRLLGADPGNRAVALLNRANIYARDGRYAQALMDYKKARERDPHERPHSVQSWERSYRSNAARAGGSGFISGYCAR